MAGYSSGRNRERNTTSRKCREEFPIESTGVRSLAGWRVQPSPPISPTGIESVGESVRLSDALDSRPGEPSTHVVCVAMTSLRIMLNCGVAEPSSALAAVPKVLARRYRGTIRCRRFAQYPSPSSVCGNEGRSEAPVASKRVI